MKRLPAVVIALALLIIPFKIYDYDMFMVPDPVDTASVPVSTGHSGESVHSTTSVISVSAVGDCTLGTDASFGIGGSFEAELMANYYSFSYYFNNVKHHLDNDDLTIINLEGTLSAGGVRANKQYTFRGPPEYINILTCSSIEAANLANNHTMDYGNTAFLDTKNLCNGNGITAFANSEIAIKEIKCIRVGLIGTNALTYEGRVGFPAAMEALKKMNPHMIIASFHWGMEGSVNADGTQVSLAHQAIDLGADLVLGHHPHVLQGVEKYKGKYIVYSLGNFCFGGNKNPDDKDTMIFKQNFKFVNGVMIEEDDVGIIPCTVSSIPSRNNYQPTPLSGKDFERVKDKIISRSAGYTGVENINFYTY